MVREREKEEETKGSGQGRGSGRDGEPECPHSDQYLCSRQNVPQSPEPFIKVMKSREAHYESDSPVRCVLHRDTHGQIHSSLVCSDAFGAWMDGVEDCWESFRQCCQMENTAISYCSFKVIVFFQKLLSI